MTKKTVNSSVLSRLAAILTIAKGKDGSDRPMAALRCMLQEQLRVRLAEILKVLGVASIDELSKKLKHAAIVAARLHTGRDCYRTIRYAVERLIEAINERTERSPLEQRIRDLGGELAGESSISELRERVASLRREQVARACELKETLDVFAGELGDTPMPDLGFCGMSDADLVDAIERLRFSVETSGRRFLAKRKSLQDKRRNGRYNTWLAAKRSRHTHESFEVWRRKHFGAADELRNARIDAALALAGVEDDRRAA